MLAAGCKPKTPEDKLRVALKSGDLEKVKAALEAGSKLEDGFADGQTALHILAKVRMGEPGDVAKFLIEQGVNPNAKDDMEDTAWDVAFEGKNKLGSRQFGPLIAMLDAGFVPARPDLADGKSVLHEVAMRAESPRIMEMLIKNAGLDPNARDDNGWTPLHDAVLAQNVPAATALLANGADANAETTKTVGKTYGRGTKKSWAWRYEAGSRPMDVRAQTKQRFGGDVLKVVKEYGGTPNEAVDNRAK
jgi:cytohesin